MEDPMNHKNIFLLLALALALALLMFAPHPVSAAPTFTVNSSADEVDDNPGNGVCHAASGNCTLRAAIMEANHTAGAGATINVPGLLAIQSYKLTIAPTGADNETTGDLNITARMTIVGMPAPSKGVVVDGNNLDRVFSVYPSAVVTMSAMTIRNGKLNNSTVSNNTASGPNNSYGGGIYNGGTLTIVASTLSGNTSVTNGGGIYNETSGGGGTILTNSTVSGNRSNLNGGGIFNSVGTTSLFNVTITNNSADFDGNQSGTGGGVGNEGAFTFKNTILALNFKNATAQDCAGLVTSQGNNIVTQKDRSTISGAVIEADPLLLRLGNYGGPTQTHALSANSPAINAGQTPNCTDKNGAILTTDQRGSPRPSLPGSVCDIGAFEFDVVKLFLPLIMK
jgi:CSLREA domain-containing protein